MSAAAAIVDGCPAGWIAACMMLIASRIARGEGMSFPDPPGRDALGIPVAIWA